MVSLMDERGDHEAADEPAHRWQVIERLRRRYEHSAATRPGSVVPREEYAAKNFTRKTERTVAEYLRELSDGVLVTSRPGLNILAARFAPREVVRVGQEHMHLANHKAGIRKAIEAQYPHLDAITVLTCQDQSEYTQALGGTTRIARIPNGLHSLDQETSTLDRRIVVAAGRLTRQKGFDLLVQAFAQVVEQHPDWQLRIYGSGQQREKLRTLIEERHLYNHVLLMGRSEQLDEELTKASMYVLSSRFEGFGMVIIEAMAHGVPVVSFNCPHGPADIITDGRDGLLVPAQDVDGMAAGISKLIASESLRRDLGMAGLETAARYSPEAVTPMWEQLFGELLATKQA